MIKTLASVMDVSLGNMEISVKRIVVLSVLNVARMMDVQNARQDIMDSHVRHSVMMDVTHQDVSMMVVNVFSVIIIDMESIVIKIVGLGVLNAIEIEVVSNTTLVI